LVEIWLPYGSTEVCVRIPTVNLLDVIEPKKIDVAPDPRAEIRNALRNPVGDVSITEIVKPGAKITLILKDSGILTNSLLVSTLMEELNSAGVKDEDVTVVVAYDPFRAVSSRRDSLVLDEELSARLRVIRHSCEAEGQEYIGRTSRGIEIYLNRLLKEADVKITVGPVEPHPIVGYSGGPEIVLPGVASLNSILEVFRLGMDERAEKGKVEDNPVHEEILEAANLAQIDFTLNIVRNSKFDVVKAFAGSVDEAFGRAVRLAEEIYRVPVERRADMIFISPGGSLFDATLQEAAVCLDSALKIVKKGKPVALVAECISGCGDKEFLEISFKFSSPKDLRRYLKRKFSIPGLVAYRLMNVIQQADLTIVSVIPEYYVSRLFKIKTARTANEAYRLLADVVGSRGKVSFLPYGRLTIPFMKT